MIGLNRTTFLSRTSFLLLHPLQIIPSFSKQKQRLRSVVELPTTLSSRSGSFASREVLLVSPSSISKRNKDFSDSGANDYLARALPMDAQLSSEAVGHWTKKQNESRKRISAVFFDMDDTLVLTHEADRGALAVVRGVVDTRAPYVDSSAVVADFLEQFNAEAWDPEHKVEVNEWRARLWGKALEEQGLKDMDLARDLQSCFDRERLLAFHWTSDVEVLVRRLHLQGIKVGIITNGHPKVQRAKLKACNAEELFDTILVGGEEPHSKPHPTIFLKACHLAGCKADEAVMVGDTLKTDIQGAMSAGFLSAIWVNVHKKELPVGVLKPDHEIATFSELQEVFELLGVFDASE